MNRALVALAAVLAALAVSIPGAFGRTLEAAAPTATPGVTTTTITIGGTFPLSGPASLYAPIPRGMEAYFKWVNTRKGPDGKIGIRGRKIVWKYYDDGYNPAQTVQLTNKLILEDKIFADVGSLGTEHNQAIRPLLNDRKIPQILVATGASYWGLQYKQFPWTIGWQPDYIAEGRIVRPLDHEERAEREDRDLLPERRLREGLPPRREDRPRREEEPDRFGAELRGDGHELRIADSRGRRHRGADTWVLLTIPTPTVRATRHGEGAQLEAGHDRDQLGGGDRRGHEGRRGICRGRVRQRRDQLRLPEEQRQPEVRERPDRHAVPSVWRSTGRAAPTRRTRSTSTASRKHTTS